MKWHSSIRNDAIGNHIGSHIYEEMVPTYRACSLDNTAAGLDVTQRRLARLHQGVGSPSNPILFRNLRARLSIAFVRLFSATVEDLQMGMKSILEQVGYDLEMLRGSEAKVLAKNGKFLETLERIVEEIFVEIGNVKEVTEVVRERAKRDGYF